MGPLENNGKIWQLKNRGFCNVLKNLTNLKNTVFWKKPPQKYWRMIPNFETSPDTLSFGEFSTQDLFSRQLWVWIKVLRNSKIFVLTESKNTPDHQENGTCVEKSSKGDSSSDVSKFGVNSISFCINLPQKTNIYGFGNYNYKVTELQIDVFFIREIFYSWTFYIFTVASVWINQNTYFFGINPLRNLIGRGN